MKSKISPQAVFKISLAVALLQTISLTFPGQVFGYEAETHAAITKEVAAFYNSNFKGNQLSETQIKLLIDGSRNEDEDPRYFNHYYDPVHNTGLTAVPGYWLSAKTWAQNSAAQLSWLYDKGRPVTALSAFTESPLSDESDFTWQRAVRDYISGNKERAFFGLGHIVHLVEDASVPDHTRNDPHIAFGGEGLFGQGSPYELWTAQFTPENINLRQYLYFKKPAIFNTLDEYFDGLANYSNKNFYSKDTIDVPEFVEPKPDYVGSEGEYFYGYRKDAELGDYRLIAYKNDPRDQAWATNSDKDKSLTDDRGERIMSDYWERLAPKAVQYAAGVVDLFFREVEKHKDDPAYNIKKETPLVYRIYGAFTGWLGKTLPLRGSGKVTVVPLAELSAETYVPPKNSGGVWDTASKAVSKARSYLRASGAGSPVNFSQVVAVPESKVVTNNSPVVVSTLSKVESVINAPAVVTESVSISTGSQSGSGSVVAAAASEPVKKCAYETAAEPTHQNFIISEVAWAGSEASASDEWIELRNISGQNLNFEGWQLVDKGDQIHITFGVGANFRAGEYIILERTDDATVPSIEADLIYTGALSNEDEGLRLFDGDCVLVDEVVANLEWPAGGTNPKRTMERMSDMTWRTYSGAGVGGIFGTPKAENTAVTSSSASVSVAAATVSPSASAPEATTTLEAAVVVLPVAPSSSVANHIVISEISAGTDASAEDEFVELYNPTDAAVDLVGWSLKKKTASGAETNLVSKAAFSGIIAPKSFFLIAHQKYSGAKTADLIYSANSQNLAYASNTAVIYNANDQTVDEVVWDGISKNGSIERRAVKNGACVAATGEGQFLGNSCDTGAVADLDARAARDPQNKNSLPEPRVQAAVADFNVNYNKATLSVALNWAAARDAAGSTTVSYILKDVSSGATTTILTSTTALAFNKQIDEVGREYKFAIQAADGEGLASEAVEATVAASSFFDILDFYQETRNGTARNYLDIAFSEYPFVPRIFRPDSLISKILVFYLNSDPAREPVLDTPMRWQPANRSNVLVVSYNTINGNNGEWYSLVLPDTPDWNGVGDSLHQKTLMYGLIEDKRLHIGVPDARQFSLTDYLTVAFYDFAISGGGNQGYRFLAADKNRYFFSSSTPVNLPPIAPQDFKFEKLLLPKLPYFSWDKSTDPDGLDISLSYQMNFATSAVSGAPEWRDEGWFTASMGIMGGDGLDHVKRATAWQWIEPGFKYIFGVRVIDERGVTSTVATSSALEF